METKSAFLSKINWTQAVAFIAMLLTMFGINLPPDVQSQIMAAIVAVSSVVTWIIKTWFSPTITNASAKVAGLQ